MSNKLIPVNFYGADLCLIEKDGEPHVAMRPVVEGMGMDWRSQQRKLSGERWRSVVVMMTTTGSDGKNYQMLCVPLRKLPGWLMSIEPSKVHPEIRNKVIEISRAKQNEAAYAMAVEQLAPLTKQSIANHTI